MNILREVQKEHSKAMCGRVVTYVGKDPARFNDLVKVFLKGPYRVTQWAGWPLSVCAEYHPELIKPHLRALVRSMAEPETPEFVVRSIVRLLQFVSIPKNLQGTVAETCFGFLTDSRVPIAIRVFSMTVLANIAVDQPELAKELRIILEDMYPYPSAGIASRAKRILKKI